MRVRAVFLILLGGSLPGLTSCAGPATPLGAVWALTPEQAHQSWFTSRSPASKNRSSEPKIHFSPSHQVLHGPSPIRIVIDDPDIDFSHYDIAILYNDLDVTQTFLRRARITFDREHHRLEIENHLIRLSPIVNHHIEVAYRNADGKLAYADYLSPQCSVFDPSPVRNFANFRPSKRLIAVIKRISREEGVNPAFSTGLIAQESGFRTHAVSWAKAVGLTQVTPLAESEVLRSNPDWPRYPDLNERPVPLMRALILSGKVNARNEWRLRPENSVRGGIEYAIELAHKWSTPENRALVATYFNDPDAELPKLVLASYNSGYTRVLLALQKRGSRWLEAPELGEARKYVNKILSYCSYFSEKEIDHENAT